MSSPCLEKKCVRARSRGVGFQIVLSCDFRNPNIAKDSICRGKLLFKLSMVPRLKRIVEKSSLMVRGIDYTLLYSSHVLEVLYEYSSKLALIRDKLFKILLRLKESCNYCLARKPSQCAVLLVLNELREHVAPLNGLGLAYMDPLEFREHLKMLITRLKEFKEGANTICLRELSGLLNSSLKLINDTKFISLLRQRGDHGPEAYIRLLHPEKIRRRSKPLRESSKSLYVKSDVLDHCEIPPYVVKIYSLSNSPEKMYEVKLDLPPYVNYLSNFLLAHLRSWKMLDEVLSVKMLREKVELLKGLFENVLGQFLRLPERELGNTSFYLACKALGVHKLMPFFLDENVDELYLDKPNTRVYLDHRDYGRCVSNVVLTNKDVNRFITHVKVESGLPLNYVNPSLKWNLELHNCTVRVSIDSPPLSFEGFSLDLRKVKHRLYTIIDLVRTNTLSLDEATFIIFHVLSRRNIIIAGEPNSGKTTLMNALDLCTPRLWRKVYVEDVVESYDQRMYGRHQMRLYVEPFETERKHRRKFIETIRLLHRTPDWVYMGELQTKEHFKAFFHALTAGLRGIQTCHAASIQNLIKRWVLHHDIPRENILELDLLIYMTRRYRGSKIIRRVESVWAIGSLPTANSKAIEVAGIPLTRLFKWHPDVDEHSQEIENLVMSPSIQKIMDLGLKKHEIERYLDEIRSFLSSYYSKNFKFEELLRDLDNLTTSFMERGLPC